MRKLCLFFVFCILPFSFYGQSSYFITDSLQSIGSKVIDQGENLNSQYCVVEVGVELLKYTPEKVTEYGFADGRVYVSKTIHIDGLPKKAFLLRLVKGKLTLYHYKSKETNTFYWEKDNQGVFELPKYHKDNSKMNFHDDLDYLTGDCPNVKNATRLVSYTINSMTDLIENYNNCKLIPFPHFRYGILVGYGLNRLETSTFQLNTLANINFKYQGNFIPGFFIDYPIEMSDFSINSGLYFTKCGYSYNYNYEDKDMSQKNTSFVANTTSINLPVLIRYTFPFMHVRPFVNAGLIYALNIKNSTNIYSSLIYPTYIESLIIDSSPHITKNQVGFSVGSGMEIKLDYKHYVFIELRYNKLYSLPTQYNLNKSEFQLMTGFNI